METKSETERNQTDLKGEHVCFHCLLLSFHMACEETCVNRCLILTLDSVLTSFSPHMQMHTDHLTGKMWQFSHHKNRIYKNRGGKTEERTVVRQSYQHSKEVNRSGIHWQRGASRARLTPDKTHQFFLGGEGGQTKGSHVPNCLVSISSSQWQVTHCPLVSNWRAYRHTCTHMHSLSSYLSCGDTHWQNVFPSPIP